MPVQGFEIASSSPIERWAGGLSENWTVPRMLAEKQARVTLTSRIGFSAKPFLQPWREEKYHPGLKLVLMNLQYRQGSLWAHVPITLELPDDPQSEIYILIGSRRDKPSLKIEASVDNIVSIQDIVRSNHWG